MAQTAVAKRSHPKGLPVLFATEMWERFSFYTMLAIFALYMSAGKEAGGLGLGNEWTTQIYGLYIGLVYFSPLIGGFIADRYLGIKRSVIIGGLIMMLGHFLLAFRPLPFFFSALVCLIMGNGLFKPNISTMLGNLYKKVPEKKDDGYNIFYMGINLGAFLSPLVAGTLRSLHPIHGWHYAFGAAGIGMIISVLVFLRFQKLVEEGDIPPNKGRSEEVEDNVPKIDPKVAKQRIWALIAVFVVVIFFWMAFNQQGLTLTFWANMATNTAIMPEMFSSINPAYILLLTFPLVTFWTVLRRFNKEPTTAAKIMIGMILTAGAFTIMGIAARLGGNDGHVHVNWLLGTYATITLGELCLSPMGLSLVSKLAPPKLVGTMMGGWFVATAIGGYLSGTVATIFWEKYQNSTFFFVLVGSSLFAALIMFLVLKWLNPIIHKAETEAAASAGEEQS
ncbi:MFS transporter [bacterium]|nr:MFS transporter [bacterium]